MTNIPSDTITIHTANSHYEVQPQAMKYRRVEGGAGYVAGEDGVWINYLHAEIVESTYFGGRGLRVVLSDEDGDYLTTSSIASASHELAVGPLL